MVADSGAEEKSGRARATSECGPPLGSMKTRSVSNSLVAAALATGVSAIAWSTPATARADVLVYGADSDQFNADVVASLEASGVDLGQIETLDARNVILTAEIVADYDAVVTWGNQVYEQSILTGDVLADFVDGGGGVVVCAWAMEDSFLRGINGRFLEEGYMATSRSPDPVDEPILGLGNVRGEHRILAEVATFSASRRSAEIELAEDADLVASYDNGEVLVATKQPSGRTVVFNAFPISSDEYPVGWDVDTDGARLLGNTVWWSMGAVCGDGFVEDDEACDDGNDEEGDGCIACIAAECGDGFVQAGAEECDDGNRVDDDECSNACLTPVAETSTGEAETDEAGETGTSETGGTTAGGTSGTSSTGADTTTTGTTSSSTTTGTPMGSDSDTDSSSAGGDSDSGGGCRIGGPVPSSLSLLLLLALAQRRRTAT